MRGGREEVPRLVEANVPVVADAQQLQVDAAAGAYLPLVVGEHCLGIGGHAIGHARVLRADVDVVKEVLLHEAAVALRVVGGKPLVFVEVERAHLGKVDAPARLRATSSR